MNINTKVVKPRYVGDTLTLMGIYKVAGVPTAITSNVTITIWAQTSNGNYSLEVIPDPDQIGNVGKFAAGVDMTGWGLGIVILYLKATVDGQTPFPDITELRDTIPFLQFMLQGVA